MLFYERLRGVDDDVRLPDAALMRRLVPIALKVVQEFIFELIKDNQMSLMFDGTPFGDREAFGIKARMVYMNEVIEVLLHWGMLDENSNADIIGKEIIKTLATFQIKLKYIIMFGCDRARYNTKSLREFGEELQQIINGILDRDMDEEDEGEYEQKYSEDELEIITREEPILIQYCTCHIIDSSIGKFKMKFIPVFMEPWRRLCGKSILFKRIFKNKFEESVTENVLSRWWTLIDSLTQLERLKYDLWKFTQDLHDVSDGISQRKLEEFMSDSQNRIKFYAELKRAVKFGKKLNEAGKFFEGTGTIIPFAYRKIKEVFAIFEDPDLSKADRDFLGGALEYLKEQIKPDTLYLWECCELFDPSIFQTLEPEEIGKRLRGLPLSRSEKDDMIATQDFYKEVCEKVKIKMKPNSLETWWRVKIEQNDEINLNLNFWIQAYNRIRILLVSSASCERDNSTFSNLVGKQQMHGLEDYYQLIMLSRCLMKILMTTQFTEPI